MNHTRQKIMSEYIKLNIGDGEYTTLPTSKFEARKPYKPVNSNEIRAAIPGTITKIMVKQGEQVDKGTPLMVLEAMKMENTLKAPFVGIVDNIAVKEGDRTAKNELLAIMTPHNK